MGGLSRKRTRWPGRGPLSQSRVPCYNPGMITPAEHTARALADAGLDPETAAVLPSPAIAEIAGRDSIAAAVVAVRESGFRTILPTVVHTGTEYGDHDAPFRAVERLRLELGDEVQVLPLVSLSSPGLWAALNGRFASVISGTFGVSSPCLACHLYMHLARVPLALALGGAPVIAGERDSHGGHTKLSQTPLGIDASIRVLSHAGIDLLEPVRHVRDGATITSLAGGAWAAGDGQLRCVHSGNYIALDGSVAYDELAYSRYLHRFLEPAGFAVIDAWRLDSQPDYEAIVRRVLEGSDAA